MGFLNKIKHSLTENSILPSAPVAPVGALPDRPAIYRNRRNFGVNFGSLFVQERFIFEKFFINGTSTEFEAITEYISVKGEEATTRDLEAHWNGYATDEDWKWLKIKGVTAVRIPVGYWHVNGGSFTQNTPFASISTVYKSAWSILKHIIDKAKCFDIGVLIDLHALPGGANTGDHSGIHLKSADFWNDDRNETRAVKILEFIADDLKAYENVIGLQIVNESVFDNQATSQKHYYRKAINHIRKINPTIPIIISDGWWTDQWVKWVKESQEDLNGQSIGVVIDAHIYHCFSENDKEKSPEQIINDLDGNTLKNLSSPADIIVGEYSHVLAEESWNRKTHDKAELIKSYGQNLSNVLSERANTGSFFWTFKFQHGDGGEWGFVPQVESGAIPARVIIPSNPNPSEQTFNELLKKELSNHANYWNNQNPDESFEHWRYQEGFTTGWADSVEFSKFNGSVIGRLGAWISSRRMEHIKYRGLSRFLWEWEQGYSKGIEAAQQSLFH